MLEPFTQGFHGNLGYRHRIPVAEQLGEASLKLTLDTSGLRDALRAAKSQIETELGGPVSTGRTTSRTRTTTSSASTVGALTGIDERDLVNRFNLRGVVRTLETFSTEIGQLQAARNLNIGTSWNRALQTLTEISDDLTQISAGRQINLNTSWGTALTTLSEIDTDLKSVAAGERLNLNTSWATALQTLSEIDTDLRSLTLGRDLNLKASWDTALRVLGEIDADLKAIATGKRLNIDSNWNLALRQLTEIDTDLKTVAAGKKLNLRNSWNKFFEDAEQVRRDIQRAGEDAKRQSAKARSKLTKDIAANALIGVGFPLLFGQGLGAALGGGLGGAAGALGGGTFGFAGSIAGTALGAAFDTALQKAQTLAKGLEDPIKNFQALRDAALLSSRALEKQVDTLIAFGRTTEAELLIQQDLIKTFGDAKAAQEYTKSVDDLNRSLSQGSVVLANFAAGPLAKFINYLADPLKAVQLQKAVTAQYQTLTPAQRKQIDAFAKQQIPQIGPGSSYQETFDAYIGILNEIAKVTGSLAKTEQELLAVRQASIKAVQAEGKAFLANLVGLEGLAASFQLQTTTQTLNSLVPGYSGLKTQEQVNAAARGLNDEQRKQFDNLRKQELTSLFQLLKLDTERAQKNQDLARSIQNTNTLLSVQPGILRDTLRDLQGLENTFIQAAREREKALAAIQFLRKQLGPPTAQNQGDLKRLASEERNVQQGYVKTAKEVRLALIEAAERLRTNLRQAVLDFTAIRSAPEGLNRFLSPSFQRQRAEQDFQLLLPLFRQAQKTFTALTGAPAREFTGTTAGVNAAMLDFIQAVDKEAKARQAIQDTDKAIIEVNKAIVEVNKELAAATKQLAEKEWKVDVNVVNQAGGSSTVQAVTGLAQ